MSHNFVWFLFSIKMACLAAATLFSYLILKAAQDRRNFLERMRNPKRVPKKAARRMQKYSVYIALLWTGMSVSQLMEPHDSFHATFWGIVSFLFLALAALSLNTIIIGKWIKRKFFSPDPGSQIRLS
jgi:hypothetical protein